MPVAGVFVDLVEMCTVVGEQIRRREVCSAAEPPSALLLPIPTFKIAVVGMHRGRERVVRMKHEA